MKKSIIIALIALLAPAAASAQKSAYDAAVARALEHASDVRADSLRSLAAVADVRADNALPGPEAEMEYLFPAHVGEQNRWSAGVTQSFDWPGAYRARSQQAEAMQATADAVLRGVVLDKALQVKLLIIDIINAGHRLDFCRSVSANVARVDSLTRRSFDLGNSTVLDVRKAALALADARESEAAVQADFEALKASLAALTGTEPDVEGWTTYPQQQMSSEVPSPELFPQLRVAQLRIAESLAAAKVAKTAALPSFAVGYRHAFEDGTHFNGFALSVSLPSWSRKRRTEAARLEAEAAAADLAFQEAQTAADIRAQLAQARLLEQNVAKFRELAGDNSYIELLRKAFDGGQITVIDFITEVNLFTGYRMKYLDLDYRLQLALARLNSVRSPYFN